MNTGFLARIGGTGFESPGRMPNEIIADVSWLDRAAYPFRSRRLELPDGPSHYLDEGEGEPLLFVHGTPTWSFEYRHLVSALRGSYRCVAPDHLGFGLSGRPPGAAYTPEAHAERLRAFVERLGLRRFTLVAHDFGGPIALPLALADATPVSRLDRKSTRLN